MNDPGSPTTRRYCMECGAKNAVDRVECWLCNRELRRAGIDFASTSTDAEKAVSVAERRERPSSARFSLSTMMLAVTLIAVLLGIASYAPGIAIGLTVLAAPAFIRAAISLERRKLEGETPTLSHKVLAFLASLGIITATAAAAGVAFYVTCWGGFFAGAAISEAAGASNWDPLGYGLITGVITGGIVGCVLGMFLVWKFWPTRPRRKKKPAPSK